MEPATIDLRPCSAHRSYVGEGFGDFTPTTFALRSPSLLRTWDRLDPALAQSLLPASLTRSMAGRPTQSKPLHPGALHSGVDAIELFDYSARFRVSVTRSGLIVKVILRNARAACVATTAALF